MNKYGGVEFDSFGNRKFPFTGWRNNLTEFSFYCNRKDTVGTETKFFNFKQNTFMYEKYVKPFEIN